MDWKIEELKDWRIEGLKDLKIKGEIKFEFLTTKNFIDGIKW